MQIIAIIFLVLMTLEALAVPFVFGKSRGVYTPTYWVLHVLFHIPLYWLLWQVAFN